MMDPGWDEMDLEANIARDRHARLVGRVEELVGGLRVGEGEEVVGEVAEDLVSFFFSSCLFSRVEGVRGWKRGDMMLTTRGVVGAVVGE